MNAEQKKRIAHEISNWRNAAQGGIEEFKSTGERMAALLQELVDAPEAEPVLVVEAEPGYWHRGSYYEGSKPHINPTKVWKLPIGTNLYTSPPADVALDAEPVGYLYTHVQSGEYHVSDYDDDYRGPERAMWHIEPVYRRTKG